MLSDKKNEDEASFVKMKLKKAKKAIDAHVEQICKDPLSPKASYTIFEKLCINALYKQAKENPEVAEQFFKFNIPEDKYNLCLSLTPRDDPQFLSHVTINGEEIAEEYKDYYITKMAPTDPRAPVLGEYTSCCQSFGSQGEEPTIYGITHPQAGFYAICKKANGLPVAQCLAWNSGGKIVFDSIESQIDVRGNSSAMVSDFFACLADHLVREHNVEQVFVGEGGETPKDLVFFKSQLYVHPVDHKEFNDSENQALLAHKDLPLLQLYQHKNQPSANGASGKLSRPQITIKPFKEPDQNTLNAIIDFYFASAENKEFFPYFTEFLKDKNFTDTDIDNRLKLTKGWYEFLDLNPDVFNWEENVRSFIEKGVNPNLKNSLGRTVLQLAEQKKNWVLAKYLIEKGAQVDVYNDEVPGTLLAAADGNWQFVEYLIKQGADVHRQNFENGETLLHIAAEKGNIALVKQLITCGVPIDPRTSIKTPLLRAAMHGKWDVVELLIKNGADVNEGAPFADDTTYPPSILHNNAFHFAIKNNDKVAIGLLIRHKAKVDDKIIMYALGHGNLETVTYLLEHHKMDLSRPPPLLNWAVVSKTPCLEVVNYLAETFPVQINQTDDFGRTPLYYAAKNANWDIAKALLKHGADPNNLCNVKLNGNDICPNRQKLLTIIEEVKKEIEHSSAHVTTKHELSLDDDDERSGPSDWNNGLFDPTKTPITFFGHGHENDENPVQGQKKLGNVVGAPSSGPHVSEVGNSSPRNVGHPKQDAGLDASGPSSTGDGPHVEGPSKGAIALPKQGPTVSQEDVLPSVSTTNDVPTVLSTLPLDLSTDGTNQEEVTPIVIDDHEGPGFSEIKTENTTANNLALPQNMRKISAVLPENWFIKENVTKGENHHSVYKSKDEKKFDIYDKKMFSEDEELETFIVMLKSFQILHEKKLPKITCHDPQLRTLWKKALEQVYPKEINHKVRILPEHIDAHVGPSPSVENENRAPARRFHKR